MAKRGHVVGAFGVLGVALGLVACGSDPLVGSSGVGGAGVGGSTSGNGSGGGATVGSTGNAGGATAASTGTDGTTTGETTGGGATTGATSGSAGQGGAASSASNTVGAGGSPPACNAGPDEDQDADGFTINEGDCNDCDKNVNPGAVEVETAMGEGPADEDCDGAIDNVPQPCDQGLAVADPDPLNGAKAIELCKVSAGPGSWGVVSAKWVQASGANPPNPAAQLANFHLGHGLVSGFGPNVGTIKGARMLGISSGTARQPTDPGYQSPGGFDKGYTGAHPQGFPKESPACPGVVTGQPHDSTALEVDIRTPSNGLGFSFDFVFYTFEWPGYVCSQYNDFFVAMLSPIPMGQADGNISFDGQGNPISVNNAFLEACSCFGGPPCFAGGKTFQCPLGNGPLQGTGFSDPFQDHAATAWLKTTAPVAPDQIITIRFGTYDSGDGVLDSTALIDNWQWIATPGTTVGTEHI